MKKTLNDCKRDRKTARISNISVKTAGAFALIAVTVSATIIGTVLLSNRKEPHIRTESEPSDISSSQTDTESSAIKTTRSYVTTTAAETSKSETSSAKKITSTSSILTSHTSSSESTSKTTTYSEQTTTEPPVQTTEHQSETTTASVETTITETEAPPPEQSSDITYINGILVVNKTYSLPADYAPGVDPQAQNAFNEMAAAAANDGISLYVVSGYRSYYYQQQLYNNYVYYRGAEETDRFSARAGHSEHQTGLAFDVNNASSAFENTPEAKWLEEHCVEYGFIIRYPRDKESITGFKYEPWHVRYLGRENAQSVYDSGLCLEEYLGITSVYQ